MSRNNIEPDSLLQFLRDGVLGAIRLGMSSEELRREIGEPTDVSTDGTVWLFGAQSSTNLQIPFADDRVYGIWLYFWGSANTSCIPKVLRPGEWSLNGRSSISEFINLMDAEKIGWKVHDELTFEDQTCVVLQSGVECLWTRSPETELQKIMLTE